MPTATQVFALTLGGVLGVNARFWLGLLVADWLGTRFPWATFLINVSGSFAIGLLAVVIADRDPQPAIRLGAITGFLGGYTTFSSYLFESFALWERGERALAAANVLGSMALGLMAVVLGVALGRALVEPSDEPKAARPATSSRIKAVAEIEAGAGADPDREI